MQPGAAQHRPELDREPPPISNQIEPSLTPPHPNSASRPQVHPAPPAPSQVPRSAPNLQKPKHKVCRIRHPPVHKAPNCRPGPWTTNPDSSRRNYHADPRQPTPPESQSRSRSTMFDDKCSRLRAPRWVQICHPPWPLARSAGSGTLQGWGERGISSRNAGFEWGSVDHDFTPELTPSDADLLGGPPQTPRPSQQGPRCIHSSMGKSSGLSVQNARGNCVSSLRHSCNLMARRIRQIWDRAWSIWRLACGQIHGGFRPMVLAAGSDQMWAGFAQGGWVPPHLAWARHEVGNLLWVVFESPRAWLGPERRHILSEIPLRRAGRARGDPEFTQK